MSDKGMLEAYRKQCEYARKIGQPVEAVYLMWRGQADVEDDDLIDVMKQVLATG